MSVTFCLGNLASLSVILIKHFQNECRFWKQGRRGRDGENKDSQMRERESGGKTSRACHHLSLLSLMWATALILTAILSVAHCATHHTI